MSHVMGPLRSGLIDLLTGVELPDPGVELNWVQNRNSFTPCSDGADARACQSRHYMHDGSIDFGCVRSVTADALKTSATLKDEYQTETKLILVHLGSKEDSLCKNPLFWTEVSAHATMYFLSFTAICEANDVRKVFSSKIVGTIIQLIQKDCVKEKRA